MLVFIKVTDYNKIVKKDKSARRWSVAMTEKKHAIKPYPLGAHVEDAFDEYLDSCEFDEIIDDNDSEE